MAREADAAAKSLEKLREDAIEDLDALIEATCAVRTDMRIYQSAVEKSRRNLLQGGRASDMTGLFDIATVRQSFSDRVDAMERARNAARQSIWRLEVAEGMAISDIARQWGFSRQLISRTLSAARPRRKRSTAS